MNIIDKRVEDLRKAMAAAGLDGWIINGTDPHQSEYVPERYRSREFISSFTGSAGLALVTGEKALLWVDSRYYLQAEEQIAGTVFEMMKIDVPSDPDPYTYLKTNLPEGSVIGIDEATLPVGERTRIEGIFRSALVLKPMEDILDLVWTDRPALPEHEVVEVPVEYAGFTMGEKLQQVRTLMVEAKATHLLLTTLDDIAWLTNLRGRDIPYNPLFMSYMLISTERACLYTGEKRFAEQLRARLEEDLVLQPYTQLQDDLSNLWKHAVLHYDPHKTSVMVERSFGPYEKIEGRAFTTDLKARKNEVELEGMRRAHLLDGVALVNFLGRLDRKNGSYTELELAARLLDERSRNEHFLGESFNAISGFGAHGAIVHYAASEESNAKVEGDGLLVLDTGGTYAFGTTDVTRTILFGKPTEEQVRDYTLVLKGHLALASARFPEGTCGYQLDVLARQFLWQEGLSYFHGTGHGVGFRLNVHEGPQSISPKPILAPLKEGMVVSDEPGIYRSGSHGIRIENLLAVQKDETTEFGTFHSFEVLTLCPLERALIDPGLLTGEEIAMVDAYHGWVHDELYELIDDEAVAYLEDATRSLLGDE
ncbi:MAG: aminopeptidase P family protein [Spirochaetales bacterium]|nr:aminopeptidase P family protein [Spirochaetales bacterium]